MSEFDDFLESVQDKGFAEMHVAAMREGKAAQAELVRATKKRPARPGLAAYEKALGGMSFWLHSGIQPHGMAPSDFAKLRPICQRLIAKGQLKPEAMSVFGPEPTTSRKPDGD